MTRVADHPIEPIFTQRHSPRAMSGKALPKEELLRLFEAARWAPSTMNSQPWRFIYGLAGTPQFDSLLALLVEPNRLWAQRAGALVMVVAKTTLDNGNANPVASLDTGSAWMSLALQGSAMGLVVHGMGGFDWAKAPEVAKLPADHAVQCMVAIGYPGDISLLPEPYQAREAPNGRRPISELIFEGNF